MKAFEQLLFSWVLLVMLNKMNIALRFFQSADKTLKNITQLNVSKQYKVVLNFESVDEILN